MNMPSKMLREADDRFLDTVQKTKKITEKRRRAVIYTCHMPQPWLPYLENLFTSKKGKWEPTLQHIPQIPVLVKGNTGSQDPVK